MGYKKKLPPELIALIHHIELNENGWWEKSIQRFILSSLWLSNNEPLTVGQIQSLLASNFAAEIEESIILSQLEVLSINKSIFKISNDCYKVSEAELKRFEQDLEDYQKIESECCEVFSSLIHKYCDGLDEKFCWEEFNEDLLNPLVHELGAKTYELISGRKASIEQNSIFREYIKKHPPDIQRKLNSIVLDFIDPSNNKTRDYILRKINAYFFLEAGNLSEETIEKIVQTGKKKISFKIFVDTNFLFSFLELHENPSNDAALSLKKLINEINNRLDIKFYVSAKTVQEAIGVLNFHLDYLKIIRTTPNLIQATSDFEFSGFAQKFFNEVKKSKSSISAEQYFAPYIKNLIAAIKPKGIELYNQNLDNYNLDQRVIDDLNDQIDYEKKRFGKETKTYEQLMHDIILWYLVYDKRDSIVQSPIDAKYWIATVDFRYLGFDAYKLRKNRASDIPICIHPASLVQILQFWIPRNVQFEKAMISNLRTPFLSSLFDNDSESVTIKIMQTLSRFEELEDLPVDTITSILVNDALRNKLLKTNDINEQIKLISDVILAENAKVMENLEIERKQKEIISEQSKEKDKKIDNLFTELIRARGLQKQTEEYKLELENRLKLLEDERAGEKLLRNKTDNYERSKKNYIAESWATYYDDNKNLCWYFIFAVIVCFTSIFLSQNFVQNSSSKLLIPFGPFFITLIFSFFNRDKIKNSLALLFRFKKSKLRKEIEFAKDYELKNERPTLLD